MHNVPSYTLSTGQITSVIMKHWLYLIRKWTSMKASHKWACRCWVGTTASRSIIYSWQYCCWDLPSIWIGNIWQFQWDDSTCFLRRDAVTYFLPQSSHWNGLSPLWYLMCTLSEELCENERSQIWHLNGLAPVWILTWTTRPFRVRNCFSQVAHV